MSCRELDRGWAAGRDADDRHSLDAQPLEQGRREVGLLLGRAPVFDRCTEIAGSVRREHLIAGEDEVLEEEPTVVSDVATVEVQDDRALATLAVLDPPQRGLDDPAVGGREPRARRQPSAVPGPQADRHERDRDEQPPRGAHAAYPPNGHNDLREAHHDLERTNSRTKRGCGALPAGLSNDRLVALVMGGPFSEAAGSSRCPPRLRSLQ